MHRPAANAGVLQLIQFAPDDISNVAVRHHEIFGLGPSAWETTIIYETAGQSMSACISGYLMPPEAASAIKLARKLLKPQT